MSKLVVHSRTSVSTILEVIDLELGKVVETLSYSGNQPVVFSDISELSKYATDFEVKRAEIQEQVNKQPAAPLEVVK